MKKLTAALFALLVLISASPVSANSYIAPTSCPQFSVNLYMGARDAAMGGQVSQLQQFLNQRYGNQLVTGYFGVMTAANVSRLQQELGIARVGGVGPLTRAAIAKLCSTSGTPTPTAGSLSAYPSSGTAPLAVNFTATVPDTNQYIIDFGDGANSGPIGAGVVAHTYQNPGTYTANLSRYISCLYATPVHCMIAVMPIASATVTVAAPQTQTNTLQVTSPAAGQIYTRGSQMNISWSGLVRETFAYEPHASIVDLYTAAGTKVGTIAITNDLKGSYDWHIPGFPQTMMCTMQYPNALCGTNVQGQYYIQVTAVVGNGFGTNETVIGTAQSGVFGVQ